MTVSPKRNQKFIVERRQKLKYKALKILTPYLLIDAYQKVQWPQLLATPPWHPTPHLKPTQRIFTTLWLANIFYFLFYRGLKH